MNLPGIADRKAELIAAIGRLNPGATPAFLEAFTPDALGRYLQRLETIVPEPAAAAEDEGVGQPMPQAA
ncbi:hypothetical protein [Phycisphaera mikurensis]|nr:hypothetical protein [Phycisphaera mikurensis]MBB6440819.1 hypothetical protein [Phycisphaera mikurensis]